MAGPTPSGGQAELQRRLAALAPEQRRSFIERLREQGGDGWVLLGAAPALQERRAPLSFAQERMLAAHELAPGSPQLNLFGLYRVRGPLELDALDAALRRAAQRHEILRTSLHAGEAGGLQLVHPLRELELAPLRERCADWSALEPVQAQQRLRAWVREQIGAPFELALAPLWRVQLVRFAAQDHALLLVLHHALADAWSLQVLVHELAQGYRLALGARESGAASAATAQAGAQGEADAPVQYADFALWQREWLGGPPLERQLAYWRERLAGVQPPAPLSADAPRPARVQRAGALAGRVVRRALSPQLSRALGERAVRAGATAYMLLLACFQLLVHRASGAREVCIGSSVAGRPHPALERSLGCFMNLLVLRAELGGNPRAGELLAATRAAVLGALAHQEAPFERVVEALRPAAGGWSEQPLFRALFALHNAPARAPELPGLAFERVELPERFARYELSLRAAQDRAGCWQLSLEYDARLWRGADAQRWLARLERLAQALASGDDARRIGELEWAERTPRAVARAAEPPPAAAASAAPASPATLWDAFAAWAAAAPQRIALITPEGELEYAALAREAERVAARLAERGAGQGGVVAVCLGPGAPLLAALLAVLRRGACFLPLDPDWPAQRSAELARAAGACCWIGPAAAAHGPGAADALEIAALAGGDGGAAAGLAYAMATSGSSGRPKLVGVEHASVLAYVEALHGRLQLAEQARMLWISGVAADLGYTSVWGALCSGRTLVSAPRELALDPDRLARFLREVPVCALKIAPSQLWAALAGAADPGALLPRDALVLGGEEPRPELVARVRELAPGCRIFNHYGPTEATIGVVMHALAPREGRAGGAPVPLGRPFAHVRACALDRYGQPLPDGLVGELYLGGACLARGYLGAPALTAAAFVPDPQAGRGGVPAGARLYRSGDRVRWRGGRLEFRGRADAQLNLHGQRLEPAEVEAALRQQPGVADARVALREREGGAQLAAFVLLAPGSALRAAELRAALARVLPSGLVPGLYVALEAWPLLATGKLDTGELARRADAAAALAPAAAASTEPCSELERRLLEIWRRVLKAGSIGVHDDFFALGGDSILALQIAARARREGIALAPRDLFEGSSIAAIAARLEAAHGAGGLEPAPGAVAAGQAQGEQPLTPIQRWFFEQPLVQPSHYNQSLLLRLARPLEPTRLRRALAQLVQRHPALALRFARGAGGWCAHSRLPADAELDPLGAQLLECVELADRDPAAQREALEAHCARCQASLSLERGELLRAVHFELGARGARLLLLAHHLLVDAVSWRILLGDLDALYRGEPLAPAGASYRDWALRMAEHARSAELRAELEFWRALPAPAPLPRDLAGPNLYGSLAAHTAELGAGESSALRALAARCGARLDAVLLAALAPVLSEWCGQPGVTIECEGHGREDFGGALELSRTVGWFTARYPLYLQAGDPHRPAAEAIGAVCGALARVPRGGVGYGALRYLSEAGAELRAQPSPPLVFNYLGQLDRGAHGELWEQGEAGGEREQGEAAGPQRDPASPRPALLAINAQLQRGRLQLHWLYGARVHRRESITALAERALAGLRRFAAELGA